MSDSLQPMDYTVHDILQAKILEWVAFPSLGDLPNPGIKSRSPALQEGSLLSEPPEKWRILKYQITPLNDRHLKMLVTEGGLLSCQWHPHCHHCMLSPQRIRKY